MGLPLGAANYISGCRNPNKVGNRDAGTGVHYGGTAPLPFERGGNGGTGALT